MFSYDLSDTQVKNIIENHPKKEILENEYIITNFQKDYGKYISGKIIKSLDDKPEIGKKIYFFKKNAISILFNETASGYIGIKNDRIYLNEKEIKNEIIDKKKENSFKKFIKYQTALQELFSECLDGGNINYLTQCFSNMYFQVRSKNKVDSMFSDKKDTSKLWGAINFFEKMYLIDKSKSFDRAITLASDYYKIDRTELISIVRTRDSFKSILKKKFKE